jgi:YNFM family putative membrane transporter
MIPSQSTEVAMSTPVTNRINRAMLCCGFSAFALLYCVQPLMPELALRFHLTPAQSSWPLSVTTVTLALALLGSGALSDRFGRKPVIAGALAAAAVLALLSALAQNFTQLLVLRALLGVALGGVPAVAMAYLNEEIAPQSLGHSMGIYIAGTALGGTAGRVIAALVTEAFSWRWALALIGAAGVWAAWEFWRSLPPARRFVAASPGWRAIVRGAAGHLRDDGLRSLYLLAFLVMGVFVSLYNYISFRLLGAPFGLGATLVGMCSLLYLSGMFSAVWAGKLADRIGRRNVLWAVTAAMLAGLLLTLSESLLVIVPGMALFTASFFAVHSVGSSWVGRRARGTRATAAALYLFFYYVGAAGIGSLCGTVWSAAGWHGVVALLALALGLALALALRLRGLVPLKAAPVCA